MKKIVNDNIVSILNKEKSDNNNNNNVDVVLSYDEIKEEDLISYSEIIEKESKFLATGIKAMNELTYYRHYVREVFCFQSALQNELIDTLRKKFPGFYIKIMVDDDLRFYIIAFWGGLIEFEKSFEKIVDKEFSSLSLNEKDLIKKRNRIIKLSVVNDQKQFVEKYNEKIRKEEEEKQKLVLTDKNYKKGVMNNLLGW